MASSSNSDLDFQPNQDEFNNADEEYYYGEK